MSNRPIFGIDIDGTLGEFHQHLFDFAELWLGKEIDRGYYGDKPLYQHMHISKITYRKVKLAYRTGGMKRSMPVYPWAAELTRAIRSWGAEVWLCTSRPYLSHDNVDGDTRHWLRRNGIQWQGIMWGEHKYRELVRAVGRERIVAVLDDLPEMLMQAESLGIPTVMAVRDHNRFLRADRNTFRPNGAVSGDDTAACLDHWLNVWRSGNVTGHDDGRRSRTLPRQRRSANAHRDRSPSGKP